MEINQDNIGLVINLLRAKQGLTQTQLSERCHISLSALSRYERGERTPTLKTALNLFHALGKKFDVTIN